MRTVRELLEEFECCFSSLGLPGESDFAAARAFLDGPAVVWVAGRSRSGKSEVAESVETPSNSVVKILVGDADPAGLYDVLVLCTPSDAVLSSSDVDLVVAATELRRATHVAVTGMDRFTDDQHKTVVDELESFRLKPLLAETGAGWSFVGGADEGLETVQRFVARAASRDDLHIVPLLQWLDRKSRWGVSEFDARVAEKERDHSEVATLAGDLPAMEARIHDIHESAQMRFRENCRIAWDHLHEALDGAARAFIAGLNADGSVAKDQANALVLEGYEGFTSEVSGSWELAEARRRNDLDEIFARPAAVARDIQLELETLSTRPVAAPEQVQRLVNELVSVDVPRLFDRVAQSVIDSIPEEEPDEDDALRRVGRGVKRWVKEQIAPTLHERMQTELVEAVDSLLQPRYDALLSKGGDAVRAGFRDQHNDLMTSLRAAVDTLRDRVDAKHDWQGSLAHLLQLEDQVLELRADSGR